MKFLNNFCEDIKHNFFVIIHSIGAEVFDVDGRMDGQSSQTYYSLFENVRSA